MKAPPHPPRSTPRPRNAFYNSQEDLPRGWDWLSLRDGMCNAREHYLTRAVAVQERVFHTNIEHVLVTCSHQRKFFAAIRRANGGHLPGYMKNNLNANLPRIAFQLANALDYLHTPTHEKDFVVVHGDIHPTNVFMHNNEPILSNFALSSMSPVPGGVHLPQPVLEDGHLAYKAPELLTGGARTTQTDVYAFGMLLYALFAGHEPFSGVTPLGAARLALAGVLPAQGALLHDALGAAIWNIVSFCCAQTPAARWTMQQVRAALLPLV